MTAGPECWSRTVGAASGFLLPAGEGGSAAASSVFDIPGLSGSLCVGASNEKGRHGRGGVVDEEMKVVGGTGAFAHGHAVVQVRRPGPGAPLAPLRLELSVSPAGS
jgi:hypothetical protein